MVGGQVVAVTVRADPVVERDPFGGGQSQFGQTGESWPVVDEFVDLLRTEHILVTHGTGFNWPDPTTSAYLTTTHLQ